MTKDKTVTMSRELAQKVDDVLYIMTGEDSYQRLVQKYGTGWWGALTEMRAELRGALAAPVVERQPAESKYDDEEAQAAFESLNPMPRHVTKFKGGYAPTEFNAWAAQDFCKKWDGFKQCAKLYTSQTAPVAVVLPERKREDAYDESQSVNNYHAECGWNACLDKVKELNQ